MEIIFFSYASQFRVNERTKERTNIIANTLFFIMPFHFNSTMNHRRLLAALLASTLAAPSATLAFQPSNRSSAILSRGETRALSKRTIMASSTTSTPGTSSNTDDNAKDNKSYLYVPSERDDHYKGNVAKYLLDLNQEKATFDFCGGKILLSIFRLDELRRILWTLYYVVWGALH